MKTSRRPVKRRSAHSGDACSCVASANANSLASRANCKVYAGPLLKQRPAKENLRIAPWVDFRIFVGPFSSFNYSNHSELQRALESTSLKSTTNPNPVIEEDHE